MNVLEFPNHLLQLQWTATTLSRLEAEAKKHGAPLDDKHPLVSPLLAGLLSTSLPTVHACCSALVAAVTHSWVTCHASIAALISHAATMKAYPLAVGAISELLLYEVKSALAAEAEYRCPYSLRTNTHPFISILTARPESGQSIVREIAQMFTVADPNSVVRLLKPFVGYVLLSPFSSPELALVGKYLHSELISIARSLHKHRQADPHSPEVAIVWLLVELLPLQPSQSDHQVLAVVSMVESLVGFCLEHFQASPEISGPLFRSLLDSCLSLCCALTVRTLPLLPLLDWVDTLLHACEVVQPHHCLCVGWLMLRNLLNPPAIAQLLRICKQLCSLSLPSLPILAFPLVQLLSQPSVPPLSTHGLLSGNLRVAAALLQQVEQVEPDDGVTEQVTLQYKVQAPKSFHSCSKWYAPIVSAAHVYMKLQSLPETVSWLKQLVGRLGDPKFFTSGSLDHTALLLSALALRHRDGELLPSLLEAFAAIAKADSAMSPSLLPFLLHLQSLYPSPDSKLAVFYSIPRLATHKLATVGVVNTLQVLGGNSFLVAMATRIMGKVWQLQDHIFPQVKELLSRPPPPSTPSAITREIALARSAVIRDICCSRPEQHGEEMLSLISGVLSESHDPIMIAMVIEGLVALCRSEVVDVATLWGVLGGKLAKDKRPLVVAALCNLFELAADLDSERHSYKAFKTVALKYLWEKLFTQNGYTCSAALRALSRFQIEDFFANFLPEEVAIRLGLISHDGSHESHNESHDSETAIPLAGCHCVQLLHYVPDTSFQDFAIFLTTLLREELKEIPRGVVYSALRRAQMPTQLERVVSGIPGKLQSLCVTYISRDVAAGLIRGTLMSTYEVPSTGTPRVPGRQATAERLQQYSTMFEGFLREGGMNTELPGSDWVGLTHLSSAGQWKCFMSALCDAYNQVRLLESCTVSVREEPGDHILEQKKMEALEWTRDQVVKKLSQVLRSSPNTAPSIILALVGVASVPDVIGQTGHVTSTDQSMEWSQETLLLELTECLTAILNETHPKSHHNALRTLVQIIQQSRHTQLRVATIFALPTLVESILFKWKILPAAVGSKLVTLASALFNHFNRAPHWYTAIVLSQLMAATMPVCPLMDSVYSAIIPHIKASKSGNLELLSLTAAFFPVLIMTGYQDVVQWLLSVVHSTLSSLPPSQLSSLSAELVCLHVATGTSAAFSAGLLSAEDAMGHVQLLADLATMAPTVCGLHLSLAVALSELAAAGHHSAASLADAVAAKWLQEVNGGEPAQILPVIWGLAGLLGVNLLSQVARKRSGPAAQIKFQETLFPLVASALEKLATHQDETICACSLWLMGQVHRSVSHPLSQQEKVPPNYNYLPSTSVLSSIHTQLEALSSHVSGQQSKAVSCFLQVLAASGQQLPPSDLSSILTPLCRSSELQVACVKCLVNNEGASGLQCFAAHCCSPMVFASLKLESQCMLAENLALLMASLPDSLLAQFLQLLCRAAIQSYPLFKTLLESFIKGLKNALQPNCSVPDLKVLLITVVAELYKRLSELEDVVVRSSSGEEVVPGLAICVRHTESWRDLMKETPLLSAQCLNCMIHCCWVLAGEEKFTSLKPVTEWILKNAEHQLVIHPFLQLLSTVRCCCSPKHSKNTLLHQTDVLHSLATWTRTNTFSPKQMRMVLLLAAVAVAPSDPNLPSYYQKVDDTLVENLSAGAQILEPPGSPVLREKLCQCLTEWLGKADTGARQMIIRFFSTMKTCEEYQKSLIWTSVAHVLLQ